MGRIDSNSRSIMSPTDNGNSVLVILLMFAVANAITLLVAKYLSIVPAGWFSYGSSNTYMLRVWWWTWPASYFPLAFAYYIREQGLQKRAREFLKPYHEMAAMIMLCRVCVNLPVILVLSHHKQSVSSLDDMHRSFSQSANLQWGFHDLHHTYLGLICIAAGLLCTYFNWRMVAGKLNVGRGLLAVVVVIAALFQEFAALFVNPPSVSILATYTFLFILIPLRAAALHSENQSSE